MTDLEQLRANLEKAKQDLEAKGYKLGEKGEFMDLVPAMKQYEFRFQDAIEQVWPDKAWWEMTNYWDIFQNSIMSGKSADEVIEDIINHIVVKEEEPAPVEKPANEALGEEHTISFNAKKFCENENEYKELTDKIKNICGMKSQDSWEDDDEVWIKFDANEDEIKKISETTGIDVGFLKKSIDESLNEAEEAEEPAPEVIDNEEDVKVSDTLFTLFSSKGE